MWSSIENKIAICTSILWVAILCLLSLNHTRESLVTWTRTLGTSKEEVPLLRLGYSQYCTLSPFPECHSTDEGTTFRDSAICFLAFAIVTNIGTGFVVICQMAESCSTYFVSADDVPCFVHAAAYMTALFQYLGAFAACMVLDTRRSFYQSFLSKISASSGENIYTLRYEQGDTLLQICIWMSIASVCLWLVLWTIHGVRHNACTFYKHLCSVCCWPLAIWVCVVSICRRSLPVQQDESPFPI